MQIYSTKMSVDLEYDDEVDNGYMDMRPLDLVTPPSKWTQYAVEEG